MTRINASIRPIQLTDQHLLAEIRELPRILNTIKSGKAKIENKTDVFKLGSNHTTFFYGRLKYLVDRHKDLVNEAVFRRFNILDYSESYKDLPQHLFNDWKPSNEVKEILAERIKERLLGMRNIKYNREPITIEEAIKKIKVMTQKKFESEFKKVLKEYGINVYREYDRLHAKPITNLGELFISCNDGWISMRFAPENFSVSKFFAKFSEDEPLNKFSYKWNIHFHDKEGCIFELDSRLNALMR